MFIGQKIRLWQYRTETLQLIVDQQYMLTVTEVSSDGKAVGTLEDDSVYEFENGCWWAQSSEGPAKLDMAVVVWNTAMSYGEVGMRVISLPGGNNIVPDGYVEKCEQHNRYFHSDCNCSRCALGSHRRAAV